MLYYNILYYDIIPYCIILYRITRSRRAPAGWPAPGSARSGRPSRRAPSGDVYVCNLSLSLYIYIYIYMYSEREIYLYTYPEAHRFLF